MLLAAERWRLWPSWRYATLPIAAGALSAWADHKLVFVPVALAICAKLNRVCSRQPHVFSLIHPIAVGFVLGTALYWCYGLAIATSEFIYDHLYTHLVSRILYDNPLGYQGYPSPSELWLEFASRTAYVMIPLSLLAFAHELSRLRSRAVAGRSPSRWPWLVWVLSSSVVFTIVDWRMTKHLAPILLPLTLGLVPERDAPMWRIVVTVAVFLWILWHNAATILLLVNDFKAVHATPDW
jgi:hypothetical protein